MREPKNTLLILYLFLIITIAPVMHVNSATAEEIDAINPNQTFDFVFLLAGNTISVSSTQITPYGYHSIWIASRGNWTLTANLQNITSSASGFWFLTFLGTGGEIGRGFSMGIIPATNPPIKIEIGSDFSLAVATIFLYITSPVDAENPVSHTIRIVPNT